MSLNDPQLQHLPTIAGNTETILAAARVFRDWLTSLRSDEHPARVLTVMVDALIGQLVKGQEPEALEGAWIVERLGKRVDGERSASSQMAWARVEVFFRSRRTNLCQTAASQMLGFVLQPSKISVGKRGVSSTYGWSLDALQPDDSLLTEAPPLDEAHYARYADESPSWLARPLFPGGVMHVRSWRGVLVFVTIIAAVLLALLIIWGVTFLISYGKPSTAELVSLLLWPGVVVFFLWQVLVRPALILVDDRIAMAPSTVNLLSISVDGQWELFREGKQRWIQLVRYTAACPQCGATLNLSRGEPDWVRRLVGRCTESPREHVYSFDRVTLRGKRLR
ncbi:MAG: hypothetical protein H7232_07040 [Aeromicrobium sp.]|nr:hypothetical protein [Burkholderiales bacterium]